MDTEGHVMTAQHVVASLIRIYVVLHDGRVAEAQVVGESITSDIAVLKLDIDPGIEPPPFADSSQVKIGDTVLAIGAPGNGVTIDVLRDSLTMGIVSQVDRYIQINDVAVANLIQFDAPVNPGNSGGPLFNSQGEIVGIVNARIAPDVGDGISYAVSANKAKRVAAEILEKGYFAYPWLGVSVEDMKPLDAEDSGLDSINGVLVVDIYNESPAETAGIIAGDIIESVNGVPMRDKADLTSYIAEHTSPGDLIMINILRDGEPIEISAELEIRLV